MQKLHSLEPPDLPDWRQEIGSDALMTLRAKLRLWAQRAREERPPAPPTRDP